MSGLLGNADFLMKRWFLGVVFFFGCLNMNCVTNGTFELHQKSFNALISRTKKIKSQQNILRAQLTRLQVQLIGMNKIFAQFKKKGQYNFANIGVKLDELRTHHQELLGKFQVLKLSYAKLQDQHKKLLSDYTKRFGNPLAVVNAGGNQVTIQVVSPETLFKSAKELFGKGKFLEAREQLKNMVKRYPDHLLTDNAYLLIGACFENTNKVYEAILWYNDALKKFPKGDQVDHALLKLGQAHYKINACPEGRAFLRRLRRKFPRSPYAPQARKLIRNMRTYCRKR